MAAPRKKPPKVQDPLMEKHQEGVRVSIWKYAGLFLILFLLLSVFQIRIEKQTDYGLMRVERLWKGNNPVLSTVDDHHNLPALSRDMNMEWEEFQTGQYIVESYLNTLEQRNPRTWNRLISVSYGDYQIFAGVGFFLNILFAAAVVGFLFLMERQKRSQKLIAAQAQRHQRLNEQLEKRIEDSNRIIEKFNRLQNKLVEAEKLASIGRLSATLAHEIRNPLSIIKSSTEIVTDEVRQESGSVAAIGLIRDEVDRIDRIVSDLLNFARPKDPKLERLQLKSLVRHWLPPVVEELEKNHIQLVPQFEDLDPVVIADPDQLYQVLLNVIWNARDALAGNQNPHIFLRTEEADARYAKLVIQDTGPGMLPEVVQQVKEPFYTTKTQGTGLGLPVSIQLMEVMGGKLEIESEVEVGTRVSLYLRRADASFTSSTSSEDQLLIDRFLKEHETEKMPVGQ